MYVVLVYDICIEGLKGQLVWRNTFKTCKKYLHHVQNSVFEGEITDVQLEKLSIELRKYIRDDVDSLIVFKSRNERWLEKEFWGIKVDKTSNFI